MVIKNSGSSVSGSTYIECCYWLTGLIGCIKLTPQATLPWNGPVKLVELYFYEITVIIYQLVLLCTDQKCLLSKAWEESSGESLLQIQLLAALKNFVIALGYQSPICYNMLVPILRRGIDVNSPDELLEDSMLVGNSVFLFQFSWFVFF